MSKNRKLIFNLVILLIIAISIPGCLMVGKMVAGMMTGKTADLKEVSMQIRFIRNLYPPETKTTEVDYLGEAWVAGKNIVGLNNFKRSGIGMYELDAAVTINGKPLPYYTNGAYGDFVNDLKPYNIEILTTSGQKASFTVKPIEEVKIKSVNNGSNEINVEEDFTIEFDVDSGTKNKEMKVSLLMDVMGTRSWVEVAHFKEQKSITFPKEVFRHLPGLEPNFGDTYLLVERYKVEPTVRGVVGAAQVISQSWDCVPIKLTGDIEDKVNGISAVGDLENDQGKMNYDISKPNAFLGKPFERAKKFALVSLTVRATKLKQSRSKTSSNTAYYGSYKVTTTTTTTTTRKFPKLPEEFWDQLIENIYTDVMGTLRKYHNIELIPMEQVLNAPSYGELEAIDDEVTEVEVSKSYKGTKNLIPTTLGAIISSVSSTFASDRPDARLIEELGVDGLIAVTVDLEMPWESFSLSPRMSIRISGPPHGYMHGPTVFAQGVVSGNGIEFDEAKGEEGLTMDILDKVIRREQLIAALDAGLSELKMKETEYNYNTIWNLDK